VCKFCMPFTGNDPEGFGFFGLCLFFGFAHRAGVNTLYQLLSGFTPFHPGIGRGNFGIDPKGELFGRGGLLAIYFGGF
jgi:hypothetical protein